MGLIPLKKKSVIYLDVSELAEEAVVSEDNLVAIQRFVTPSFVRISYKGKFPSSLGSSGTLVLACARLTYIKRHCIQKGMICCHFLMNGEEQE